ncbi:MAG TPA: hypothetical protein EYH35_03815 [Thiotrichaceae bacterium]|nr:hypothetical protein [Thiotrichaceae bacterium]
MELKMTKTKKIIISTLLSIITVGGLFAYNAPDHHFGKFGGMSEKKAEFIINRISSKLDLTAVQKENLVALKDTIKQQKAKHQDTQHPRAIIANLLSEPTFDEVKALEIVEERLARAHSAAPTVIAALANFTNSLNDEQRSKIKAFASKMGKHK